MNISKFRCQHLWDCAKSWRIVEVEVSGKWHCLDPAVCSFDTLSRWQVPKLLEAFLRLFWWSLSLVLSLFCSFWHCFTSCTKLKLCVISRYIKMMNTTSFVRPRWGPRACIDAALGLVLAADVAPDKAETMEWPVYRLPVYPGIPD